MLNERATKLRVEKHLQVRPNYRSCPECQSHNDAVGTPRLRAGIALLSSYLFCPLSNLTSKPISTYLSNVYFQFAFYYCQSSSLLYKLFSLVSGTLVSLVWFSFEIACRFYIPLLIVRELSIYGA